MGAYKHESITVSSTAIGFTEANITSASSLYNLSIKSVLVTVETNPIRFTVDGTTPTSTVGHLLNPGDVYTCFGEDAVKFKAIRTGSDATIKCTFSV